MKKHLVLLLLTASLPLVSVAQSSGQVDPQRCTRLCNEGEILHTDSRLAKYARQLDQIEAQKKAETDPAKLKALAEQEEDVRERAKEAQQKLCTYICTGE